MSELLSSGCRSVQRDFIDEGKLIETPRSNLCDVSEITAFLFARKWLCTDVRWYEVILSVPNESTCNVAVVDARSVLVHPSLSPSFENDCDAPEIVYQYVNEPRRGKAMSTSLPILVCFIICFGECPISISIDAYIEAFLQVTKKFLELRYRNTCFNNIIIGECIDLDVYLRIFIHINISLIDLYTIAMCIIVLIVLIYRLNVSNIGKIQVRNGQ